MGQPSTELSVVSLNSESGELVIHPDGFASQMTKGEPSSPAVGAIVNGVPVLKLSELQS